MLGIAKISSIIEGGKVYLNIDELVQHLKDNEPSDNKTDYLDFDEIEHSDIMQLFIEDREELYFALETLKQDALK